MNEWESTSGEHWATNADRYTRMLAPFGEIVMDGARLVTGERVLDVGCGSGDLCISAARAVGPTGHVIGVDLSTAMLAVASARVVAENLTNIDLVADDATTYSPPSGPLDVAISRFGVMFFDDPIASFTNIRATLTPSGRMTFVCWQGALANDWTVVPGAAIAEVVGPPPPDDPLAPGPFALADAERIATILTAAGFTSVAATPVTAKVWLGADIDDAVTFLRITRRGRALLDDVEPAIEREALDRVRRVLEPYESPAGVELGGAVWRVDASA